MAWGIGSSALGIRFEDPFRSPKVFLPVVLCGLNQSRSSPARISNSPTSPWKTRIPSRYTAVYTEWISLSGVRLQTRRNPRIYIFFSSPLPAAPEALGRGLENTMHRGVLPVAVRRGPNRLSRS